MRFSANLQSLTKYREGKRHRGRETYVEREWVELEKGGIIMVQRPVGLKVPEIHSARE